MTLYSATVILAITARTEKQAEKIAKAVEYRKNPIDGFVVDVIEVEEV